MARTLFRLFKMARHISVWFFRFMLLIFRISLLRSTIFDVMCSRCDLQESFGSSLMPRNTGNGSMGIGELLMWRFNWYVLSQLTLFPAKQKTVYVVLDLFIVRPLLYNRKVRLHLLGVCVKTSYNQYIDHDLMFQFSFIHFTCFYDFKMLRIFLYNKMLSIF